jgi:hypothetical protein
VARRFELTASPQPSEPTAPAVCTASTS